MRQKKSGTHHIHALLVNNPAARVRETLSLQQNVPAFLGLNHRHNCESSQH